MPTVELLSKTSHQESEAREIKGMAHTEAEWFERKDQEVGDKNQISPTYNKSLIYDTRQQNKEVYDRSLNLLNTSEIASINGIDVEPRARESCGIEGEKYEDIPRCRNRTSLGAMPLALGQLLP